MRRLPGGGSLRRACSWGAAFWISCGIGAAGAQSARPAEYEVKAAYLYNFARFVEWPAAAASMQAPTFAICVLGPDPFGPYLDTLLNGVTIGGKPAIARRLAVPGDAAGCPVLFISAAEGGRLDVLLGGIDRGTLTVSDIPAFTRSGGMIQFVPDGNRIRFEVNQTATERAGLTLSAELLKVAVAVRRGGGAGD